MARRVIRGTDYVFTPAERKLVVPAFILEERLLLITNVTTGTIIYNFADANLGYSSWSYIGDPTNPRTQIVLEYNTAGMSSTDLISVMVDEFNETVNFTDTLLDTVEKLRVAAPQSLMDTDFEYSIQPSKWEALFLANNYPTFFAKTSGGNSFEVTNVQGNGAGPRSLVTVTTATFHNLVAGNIVSVQDTLNFRAEGTFLVHTTPTPTTFTYFARGLVDGVVFVSNYTTVYGGDVFDNAHIPGGNVTQGNLNGFAASSNGGNPSVITITTTNPHGLFPGTPIMINNTGGINGNWIVKDITSPTTFTFEILDTVVTAVSTSSSSILYTKPEGYVQHRPLDGGVSLTTLGNAIGLQTIRQTRRYFRYQSGKSIQFSTGAKLTPSYDITTISANNVTGAGEKVVTVVTLQDHGMQPGCTILIEGVQTISTNNPYNGTFVVDTVSGTNIFTYKITIPASLNPTDATPGGVNLFVTAKNWKGAATRAGLYDEQNGFYFEYDGTSTYVVRRFSNKEIAGNVNAVANSSLITGNNTQFRKQLVAGDKIVIRGMSYQVQSISNDTTMFVSPAYRGVTVNFARATKTQEIRIRQDKWNLDNMDGRGPGGYNLDITKMQMIYIDYTWYGAGYIRWGFRAIKGDIIYVHRMANNNINTSAYQRSGNLPARYEVINEGRTARLVGGATQTLGSTLSPSDTTMYVDDIEGWSPNGYLMIRNDSAVEVAAYGAVNTTYNATMRGYAVSITRRQSYPIFFPGQVVVLGGGNTANTAFSPDVTVGGSGTSQVSITTITQTCAPQISHWGSSVIMDGRFDQDAENIFTAGMTKQLAVTQGTQRPLLAVRLAPSVDNAVAKNFGVRELINRMQMRLASVGVSTNGQFLIQGFLNPQTITYTNHTEAATRVSKTISAGANASLVTLSDVQNIAIGMSVVSGTNLPVGAVIVAISGNVITLSVPTLGTPSGPGVFGGLPAYRGIPLDWDRERVGSGSLAQVLYFDNTGPSGGIVPASPAAPSGAIQGGDAVFSFYSENGGGGTNFNVTSFDLKAVRELGNSILSGNGNASSPSYPNGPDILVITATNIGAAVANITARISWIEAQA
jgi:hypothetical protein